MKRNALLRVSGNTRKSRDRLGVRGQISIMIALMMATLLIFFQFVVNVGLLVNAKINLQNAADLAAYAGAAAQARNLNRIGYLNYEMRRQYKKFLFRYYVLGNMFQDSHPKVPESDPTKQRAYTPGVDGGYGDVGIPSVCLAFDNESNFCRNRVLSSGLPVNPPPVLDPIGTVLQQQLEAFETLRQEDCKTLGKVNANVLGYWLFNTDPTLEKFETLLQSGSNGGTDSDFKALQTIKTIVAGLGLIPKLVILSSRIKTLAGYINAAPKANMDVNELLTLQADTVNLPEHEHSVLAFKSAYYTLGEHLFDSQSIRMTELSPIQEDNADLIDLVPNKINFETYYTDLLVVTATTPAPDGTNVEEGSCVQIPTRMPIRDLTVGFAKDPKKLTYYAVRVEANLNLLYTPFGNNQLTLRAYSAAQPFGSRIGPVLTQEMLVNDAGVAEIPPNLGVAPCSDCQGTPNIGLYAGQGLNKVGPNGYNLLLPQSEYYRAMTVTSDDFLNQRTFSKEDIEVGHQAAMAPNPAEKGLYIFPNDLGLSTAASQGGVVMADPFQRHFASDAGPDTESQMFFWAPITAATVSDEDAKDEIKNLIEGGLDAEPDDAELLANYVSEYIDNLKTDADPVDNMTYNVAALSNPYFYGFHTKFVGQAKAIELDANDRLLMKKIEDVRSSWSDLRVDGIRQDGVSQNFRTRGRNGYSVKFVSFKYLLNPGADGTRANSIASETWINTPGLDADAIQEIGPTGQFIDH